MKKNLLGVFIAILLFTSFGCNQTELTGSSTLEADSKTWISATWAGREIDFVDSANTKRTFKFTQLIDKEELQTYDCSKSFFGSTCFQYQTQSISLAGKWIAADKSDSLSLNYLLAQADAPDNITDVFTAQLVNKSNQSTEIIRVLNPPLIDSLQTQQMYADSLTLGSQTFKKVYYYTDVVNTPGMAIYYTKADGMVGFKVEGKSWYIKP